MSPPGVDVLNEPIGIIGAGIAGLINAHVLLQDGFTDVTLISRDSSVGGTWARHRVYPGLFINNVHGEYRFSALDMPPPKTASEYGSRLSGMDMCEYMERFSQRFLEGKAKFEMNTEVLSIERDIGGQWKVRVQRHSDAFSVTLGFSRIILASGGCSNLKIPVELSQEAANKAGCSGLIFRSSQFASELENVLKEVPPRTEAAADGVDTILVIGGGKSARDICAKLTNEGRKVAIVFEHTESFLASKTPPPAFLRNSRLINVLAPHSTLNTRLERFLHTTWIGGIFTRWVWRQAAEEPFRAYGIPVGSPLRRTHPLFWGIRIGDEGHVRPDSFHSLDNAGAIEVIAPARVLGYAEDGESLLLSNGRLFRPKVVVLATGYQSSWTPIFTQKFAEDIGINRHEPTTKLSTAWNYTTLKDPPALKPENKLWVTSIYRGLIPAKNIERRDFAIAGALCTANPGYTNEVVAHWIAPYFRGDKMRLPTSQEAFQKAEEQCAWMKVRFPGMLSWLNESYSTSLDFWTLRSGGNRFNWMFKIIDLKELGNVTQERQARRSIA
ncbi:hypothetical protein M413DRAFT_20887 [Hebeloma cylindrosporum]|uniref:FAD/NAD(P)-binding domain-containing protein n=1 Tax=Hebeloma cylindrosporum TaxID=76867 RepID=A0A0C3BRN0_HEBCY|nr:hypothetical protein M413DRAFT_20887 [Hebeloma cylindrosporum h7]